MAVVDALPAVSDQSTFERTIMVRGRSATPLFQDSQVVTELALVRASAAIPRGRWSPVVRELREAGTPLQLDHVARAAKRSQMNTEEGSC